MLVTNRLVSHTNPKILLILFQFQSDEVISVLVLEPVSVLERQVTHVNSKVLVNLMSVQELEVIFVSVLEYMSISES